jgi:hypothetical protein
MELIKKVTSIILITIFVLSLNISVPTDKIYANSEVRYFS